jgi:hypothetical protein
VVDIGMKHPSVLAERRHKRREALKQAGIEEE